MSSSPEFLIQLLIIVLAALTTTTITLEVPPMSLPNCSERCGNVEIPYPFGTSEGCFLSDKFSIHCNHSFDPPTPFIRNSNSTEVTNISLIHGEFGIMHSIARVCYHGDSQRQNFSGSFLDLTDFHISEDKNKFTAVGCDIFAVIEGYRGKRKYTTGCISSCDDNSDTSEYSSSDVGCCQTSIPSGLKNITLTASSSHKLEYYYNQCSYAFVVQDDKLKFSRESIRELNHKEKVPVLLTWAIGEERCHEATKNGTNYACKANSKCVDATNGPGYLCQCLSGYEGNPYLPHGCKDIDECNSNISNPCGKNSICKNIPGNFTCSCEKGFNKVNENDSCSLVSPPRSLLPVYVALGVCILVIGISLIYWGMKKRKAIKLRLKFFEQNGGLMLQQQLSSTSSLEATKIFSADELKRATNNYNENRVVGQGGYGIVYKGTLPINKVVAIKKSKFGAQRYNKQFINEVVMLLQINHRNVVKLLGCCLETEVPLLVYEFISNGTLFEHIHNKDNQGRSPLSWELRLKIATETAGALAYLHSAASTPIIHRDVKTGNILLDENFTAKVSDFGASRLIPPDQDKVSTVVQGTLGYLDPEYMQSNQLTEKSDVYSFGVVLAELLTGKKVLSFERPEEERSLAMLFVSAMKDDRLLIQIIDDDIIYEGNVEALKCVANLTERCLRVKSEERPTMKEVEMELQGVLRTTEMHQSGDVLDLCVEKTASDPPDIDDSLGSISYGR